MSGKIHLLCLLSFKSEIYSLTSHLSAVYSLWRKMGTPPGSELSSTGLGYLFYDGLNILWTCISSLTRDTACVQGLTHLCLK